jgi:outer membrane protein TolC
MLQRWRIGLLLRRAALGLLLTLVPTGCTNLSEWIHNGFKAGHNYERPPTPVSREWIDSSTPGERVGDLNRDSWWDVFDDPVLTRLLQQASANNLDQSVDNANEVGALLLANVATRYIEIRTFQKRLELARKNVELQAPLVAVYQKRYQGGIANAYPGYQQLLANLENTRALVPFLEISLRQANNALCILLGISVRDLLPELGDGTFADPEGPNKRKVRIPLPKDPAVIVGIPAELLLRRPDVRAAEDALRIQSAQIGVAEAEMLPPIGVNGSIGLSAGRCRLLVEGRSATGDIGPSLTWNIRNYDRLLANVRFRGEAYQQLVAQYQQAIRNANEDVENALAAYLRTIDQAEHLQKSADAALNLTNYLIRQYQRGDLPPGALEGSAFVTQLFTAVNLLATQQDAAAQAEGNIALNLILVYRAMGGGWQIRKDGQSRGKARPKEEGPEMLPSPKRDTESATPEEGPILPPPAPLEERKGKG